MLLSHRKRLPAVLDHQPVTMVATNRERKDGIEYIHDVSLHFLHGVAVYKKKTRLMIPLHFYIILPIIMEISLVKLLFESLQTRWVNVLCYIMTISTPIICTYTIMAHKQTIIKVNQTLSVWWKHRLMENETEKLKKKNEELLDKISFYYSAGLYSGFIGFVTLPLGKFIISQTELEPVDLLIFPCWTPVSLKSWWAFTSAYIFEGLVMMMVFVLFIRLQIYCISVTMVIGCQEQLIGKAFLSIEERIEKIMESKLIETKTEWQKEYLKELKFEIKSCVQHYQSLLRCSQLLSKIYMTPVSTNNYIGKWVMCLLGVQIAFGYMEDNFLPVQAGLFLTSGIFTLLLFSLISEILITEAENLRQKLYCSPWFRMPLSCQKSYNIFQMMFIKVPTLKTFLGQETSVENFSNVINGAYCYFSLIIAMMTNS